MSMRAIARDLQVSEGTIYSVVQEGIQYKLCDEERTVHVTHTRIIIAPSKMFTQQVETSRRTRYVFFPFFSFFLSKWNKFPNRIKKWTREMTGGYVQTLLISMLCTPSLLLLCWFYNSSYRCWIVKDMLGMPSHFFEQTLRLNAAGYTEVLETVLKPWIDLVCDGRPYVFQKDWTCSQCHSGPRLDGS